MPEAPLDSWINLNAFVRKATEAECVALLARESALGSPRLVYLYRIQSRINLLRNHRERADLAALVAASRG
jgi:hypothetical protein